MTHLKMPRTGFHCMTWLSLALPEPSTTCGSNLRRDRGIVSLLTTSYHPAHISQNLGVGCTLPAEPFTAAMYQRVSTFSFQCQVRVGVLGKTLEPRQLGKVIDCSRGHGHSPGHSSRVPHCRARDVQNTGCRLVLCKRLIGEVVQSRKRPLLV